MKRFLFFEEKVYIRLAAFFIALLSLTVSCSKSDDKIDDLPPIEDEDVIDDEDVVEEEKYNDFITQSGVKYSVSKLDIVDVNDGVRHALLELHDDAHPVVAHAVLIDLNKDKNLGLEVFPAHDEIVYSVKKPTEIVKNNKSSNIIATINGDFFHMTGDYAGKPLGAEISGGKLRKTSQKDWKTVFGFSTNGKPFMGQFESAGTVTSEAGETLNLDAFNDARSTDDLVLYNYLIGTSSRTNEWGTDVLLSNVSVSGNTTVAEIIKKFPNEGDISFTSDQLVLSGHGTSSSWVNSSTKNPLNSKVTISFETNVKEHNGDIIKDPACLLGAHSIILQDSIVQNINDDIANAKHPRTAVGFSKDKTKIVMIVVEGRSEHTISKGVSTSDLAELLAYFKMSNAVNLDGGGSSILILEDETKNVLSGDAERSVTNVLSLIKNK